jgi:hypothetical protein
MGAVQEMGRQRVSAPAPAPESEVRMRRKLTPLQVEVLTELARVPPGHWRDLRGLNLSRPGNHYSGALASLERDGKVEHMCEHTWAGKAYDTVWRLVPDA